MKSNKTLKVLSTGALVATLVVPVGTAFAASTYTTATPVSTAANNDVPNVRVTVAIDPGSLTTTTETIRLRLPADSYATVPTATVPGTDGSSNNQVANVTFAGVGTPATGTGVTAKYNEFTMAVDKSVATTAGRGLFYIDIPNVHIPSGQTGAFNVTFEAQPGSPLSSGSITVASVGSGAVTTSIDDVKAVKDGTGNVLSTIRIKEDRPGAIVAGSKKAVKFKLPKGFKWDNDATATRVYGDFGGTNGASLNVKVDSSDPRSLYLDTTVPVATPALTASNTATYYSISGLKISADSSEATVGEVTVDVSGDSSISNSTLLVGNYGNFTGKVTAAAPKTVIGGSNNEKIGDFTIQEDAPGTLLANRVVKLTLGGNAKWGVDANGAPVGPKIKEVESDKQGFEFDSAWTFSGSDRTTIQRMVKTASSNKPAKIAFEKGEIDVAPNSGSQDITVTVGGTAGIVSDAIVVGKAISPVVITTESTPTDIIAGVQSQAIPTFTIKETASENIGKGNLVIIFPEGVRPSLNGAKVEVTDGDLKLNTAGISASDRTLTIPVSSISGKASTIKVSGLSITTDRYVPEGALMAKVIGSAVVPTTDGTKNANTYQFDGSTGVAVATLANVVTPASTDKSAANVVFKLGSTSYTVNGVEKTMDVAPFAQNNRTFLPVRFAAEALGAQNVQWDQTTKTVTVFKDGNIVQMVLGKKEYKLNGIVVPMDVAVMATKEKRVVLPIRFLSDALSVPVNYNEAAGTVTLGNQK